MIKFSNLQLLACHIGIVMILGLLACGERIVISSVDDAVFLLFCHVTAHLSNLT